MTPIAADMVVERGAFTLELAMSFAPGTVTAVLGPNGAGKTTLLRALAGLDRVSSGAISIGGRVVDESGGTFVPPQRRSVGVVFQDYALFPHLSVLENVAFGLRARGLDRRRARATALRHLADLRIDGLRDRQPSTISGGQAQGVALARALAIEPEVLLLDEPLAALDALTRQATRVELDDQLDRFVGCVVLVTHDPIDALVLADRVIILENGRVAQDATPAELARRPRTPYAAALMGVNLLSGSAHNGQLDLVHGEGLQVADTSIAGHVMAIIRPESIGVDRDRPPVGSPNTWPGRIMSLEPVHDRVRVVVDGQLPIAATVAPATVNELQLGKGVEVWLSVHARDIDVFGAD